MFYSVCSLPCSRRHRNCATGVLLGVSLPSFLSGEERISFLSPARAAGLLFSPMRQKERSPKNTARKAPAPWPFPALFGPPPETATYGRSLSTCRLPSEKFRPRARPPAPALRGRCPPRTRDAKHRDKFSPKLRPHAFLRAMPPRRGGRPTPVSSHLATNRNRRSRESPPPHTARGAARHSKTGPLSAKPAGDNSLVIKNCSAPRSLSARQRNLVQTQGTRLNDFAL